MLAPDLALWRSLFFDPGELQNANLEATLWGDRADPDRDRLPNQLEYFFGTAPDQYDVLALPTVFVAENLVNFSYRRSGDDSRAIGRPEYSTDLLSWSTDEIAGEQIENGNGHSTITVSLPLSSERTALFFRLRLSSGE